MLFLNGLVIKIMKKDLIIKKKMGILGKGVFANRNFEKDEVVIKYNLKHLTKVEFENLPKKEKNFVHNHFGILYLYSVPERYVNHSLTPNTLQDLKKKCKSIKHLYIISAIIFGFTGL